MILFVETNIKELSEKGRDYPWQRPANCPRCGNFKVWGHGYVGAWFDGFLTLLFLKRYRCPDCKLVIRYRPTGYFRRFQAPVDTIRSRIAHRLKEGRWPPGLSRSRQRHWLKGLRKQATAYLENAWSRTLSDAFDRLIELGRTPVSRSI